MKTKKGKKKKLQKKSLLKHIKTERKRNSQIGHILVVTPCLLKVKQWFCPFRVQYIGRLGNKNALLHLIAHCIGKLNYKNALLIIHEDKKKEKEITKKILC